MPKLLKVLGSLLPALVMVLSCGVEPEEGEIVIRAADLTARDTTVTAEDTLILFADTASSDSLTETVAEDSMGTATDSLPVDTVEAPVPDTLECPWTRLALEINGSIYASLTGRVDNPDVLGAHIVRCMWWNTDPWRRMNAGDSLFVLVGETGRENSVVALRYQPEEGTSGQPFSVYSYRMTGDNYPSHYYADGTEVMKLLSYMPVSTFEEMTGPYGEPRGDHEHTGVDFKAPPGTPVRTCRGGTVVRTNWNYEYNGNCVEVNIGAGYTEIFLHLQAIEAGVREGTVLQRGDTVGCVGNTGVTSTAPHIHYQINDERGNPIDPYLFYSSYRRSLPPGDMDEFAGFRDSCDRWLRAPSL
ncbi:MAG: M23 family metallopeptidase [Candidatus Fermentibacteraceae bacterium]|nr:M23 family metallopeptidase [Candidatus Fermentibacteraceae bacterium]MBN2608154.1 M23 family metallopeptidase [Candidatus Fermentibacteraceae bacterium]